MSEVPTIDVDVILAAIVNDCNGYLEITEDSIIADYSNLVMSITYNDERKTLVVQLVDEDSVEYAT